MKSLNEYYDHHPNDSRVTGPHTIANSVCARYGTGGGNTPIILVRNSSRLVQSDGDREHRPMPKHSRGWIE